MSKDLYTREKKVQGRGDMVLTGKQEQFALNVVKGMSLSDAYRECYDCEGSSDETIWTEASLLNSNPKVAKRIQELRDQLAIPHIMTAQERLELLTDIIKASEEHDINARLKAMDIMNKMTGEYVQKIDANVNADVDICIELSDE